MTADELIDGYVADVVTLLPRGQRRDVAQELRVLLREEASAAASGQASREQAARSLLAGFGRPADVAARYGAPVALIDPADTRRFLTLAMAGAVLIPFGAILNELTGQPGPERSLGQGIEKTWPGVFAWLGLLVVGFAVAAWARRRRPDAGWKPRPVPTDRISRPGRAAAIIFFVLGTLALMNPAWLIRTVSGGRAAPTAYEAFAYDEGFLRLRGPVVLGFMIAGLVILAILLWEGRWRPWIRPAEMVHSLAVVPGPRQLSVQSRVMTPPYTEVRAPVVLARPAGQERARGGGRQPRTGQPGRTDGRTGQGGRRGDRRITAAAARQALIAHDKAGPQPAPSQFAPGDEGEGVTTGDQRPAASRRS